MYNVLCFQGVEVHSFSGREIGLTRKRLILRDEVKQGKAGRYLLQLHVPFIAVFFFGFDDVTNPITFMIVPILMAVK